MPMLPKTAAMNTRRKAPRFAQPAAPQAVSITETNTNSFQTYVCYQILQKYLRLRLQSGGGPKINI